MATDKDQIYSKHILQAIEEIESFIHGMTLEQFEHDVKTQMAVTRELEIIGEAAKRLSEEFQDKLGRIPWTKISGMRDFLIHHYTAVDMEEVWKVGTQDALELKQALEKYQQQI